MPRRIQRESGKELPPNTVFVDGNSRWRNPYLLDHYKFANADGTPAPFNEADAREMSLRDYEASIGLYASYDEGDIRRELRGKNLASWAPLGVRCHADILLEIANEETSLRKLSVTAFRTLRAISLAHSRDPSKPVRVEGLVGVNKGSLAMLVRKRLLLKVRGRYRPTALARHEEQLFLETRLDTVKRFECSRCREVVSARDGGCPDEVDPNGDYCSSCWCQESLIIGRPTP